MMKMSEGENVEVEKKGELPEIIQDEDLDPSFPEEVKEKSGQNVYACYQCGTCVTGCPVTDFGQNTKKLIRKIIFGFRDEVIEDPMIWLCSECYYCAERCPQGVHLPTIWVTLRNMAVEKGAVPDSIKMGFNIIKKTGRVAEVSEAMEVRRESLNLPKAGTVPNEVIDEIDHIVKKTQSKEDDKK